MADCKKCIHEQVCDECIYGKQNCQHFINSADVAHVVKCEFCKHCEMVVDIIGDPHLFCGLSPIKVEKQFGAFCSDGEPRGNTP